MPPKMAAVQVGQAIAEMRRILLPMSTAVRDHIGKFLKVWMSDLSYSMRKGLSHYGAIRRRSASDPVGRHEIFTITTHDRDFILDEKLYFDPGNLVYSFAFRLLWNDIWQQCGWNQETMGDIIESILGFHYLNVLHGRECVPAKALSNFFEDLSYNVWRVLLYSGDESLWRTGFPAFHDWVRVRI